MSNDSGAGGNRRVSGPKWGLCGAAARRIAVIGGAGYIGGGLVRRLADGGARVVVLDRLDWGDRALRPALDEGRCDLVVGDFRDDARLAEAIEGADAVVHLAGLVGDRACALNERETIDANFRAVGPVARACMEAGVARFVFASTCSVYGASPDLVDETSVLNPISLYATSKIDAENLLLGLASPSFHPVILRLGTAFGWAPRPRFDLVVNLLTAKCYFDDEAVIYNGEQWRPFVHVDDIARAFEIVLEAPLRAVSGEIFNVGDERMNHRLDEVGDALQRLRPRARVVRERTPDARDYRVDFSKIRTWLGFRARVGLLDGIAEIDHALASGAVADYRAPVYHNHLAAEATAAR